MGRASGACAWQIRGRIARRASIVPREYERRTASDGQANGHKPSTKWAQNPHAVLLSAGADKLALRWFNVNNERRPREACMKFYRLAALAMFVTGCSSGGPIVLSHMPTPAPDASQAPAALAVAVTPPPPPPTAAPTSRPPNTPAPTPPSAAPLEAITTADSVCGGSAPSEVASSRYGAYRGVRLPTPWVVGLDTEEDVTATIYGMARDDEALTKCFERDFPDAVHVYNAIRLTEAAEARRTPAPTPTPQSCEDAWSVYGAKLAGDLSRWAANEHKRIREDFAQRGLSQQGTSAGETTAHAKIDAQVEAERERAKADFYSRYCR